MIEIGKRSNGVTLFNNKELVKIDIIKHNSDFLVNFDTRYHDLLKAEYYQWFMYFFEIHRNENPKLCISFDEFFEKALRLLINEKILLEKHHKYGSNKSHLLVHSGKQLQVNYPSDDDQYKYATTLGITNLNSLGYSIDFDKSRKDMSKLTFLLKQDGHYPELAKLYSDLFLQMFDLANRSYDDCQEEFDYSYIKRKY